MSNDIRVCLRFDHLNMVDPSVLFSQLLTDIRTRNALDSGEDLIFAHSCEVAKQSSKLHYHCYFAYASDKLLDSEMRAIRRILKREGYEKHLFCCQKLKRTPIMYLTYMFKDGDIQSHNLPADTVVNIEDNIEEFNALKDLPMREQLLKLYSEEIGSERDDSLRQTDAAIGSFVLKVMKQRGHNLPYPFHMKQYISHIQMNLFDMCTCEIYAKIYQ